MRHARLSSSARLQAVLSALQSAGELSTRQIILRAGVCAVNSCIAELRANGAIIECRQEVREGKRLFLYSLIQAPGEQDA